MGHVPSRRSQNVGCALAAALICVLGGCTMGPTMLESTRMGYNQAIQETTNEQLLLNLVRLKYRDQPLFLEVSSISAQFQFNHSVSATGTLNENVGTNPLNANKLNLNGSFGFTDRPTVTFTPLQGDKFATRMLEPIGLDAIFLLIRSGWSADRVLRIAVQQMNGTDNASRASGPTPCVATPYREFAEASALWRDLGYLGIFQVGYESGYTEVSPSVPVESVGASDLLNSASKGLTFRPANDSPDRLVVTAPSRSLIMRVANDANDNPQWKQFSKTLGLDSSRSAFTLRATGETKNRNGHTQGNLQRISIAPRSLMGVLFYLSHAIEIPSHHASAQLVTETLDKNGQPFDWSNVTGNLLRVHSQKGKPDKAAIAVQYRNYWFYINDNDLESKSTFSLLGQLFALRAGKTQGGGLQLTLPL